MYAMYYSTRRQRAKRLRYEFMRIALSLVRRHIRIRNRQLYFRRRWIMFGTMLYLRWIADHRQDVGMQAVFGGNHGRIPWRIMHFSWIGH